MKVSDKLLEHFKVDNIYDLAADDLGRIVGSEEKFYHLPIIILGGRIETVYGDERYDRFSYDDTFDMFDLEFINNYAKLIYDRKYLIIVYKKEI